MLEVTRGPSISDLGCSSMKSIQGYFSSEKSRNGTGPAWNLKARSMLQVDGGWKTTISGLVPKLHGVGNSSVLQKVLYTLYLFLGFPKVSSFGCCQHQVGHLNKKALNPTQSRFTLSTVTKVLSLIAGIPLSQVHHGPQRLVGYVPRVCSPAQLPCDTPARCWKLISFSWRFLKHIGIKILSKSTGKQLGVKPRKGTRLILLFLGSAVFLFPQPGFQDFVLLLRSKVQLKPVFSSFCFSLYSRDSRAPWKEALQR